MVQRHRCALGKAASPQMSEKFPEELTKGDDARGPPNSLL